MTKRILVIALALFLIVPLNVLAVQDVILTAIDIFIENPGITLQISGATVDQLLVNTTSTVITMSAGGSAVTITSTNKYTFSVSGISDPGTVCGASNSTLTLPSQVSAVAVTVTPLTTCSAVQGSGTSFPSSTSSTSEPAPTTSTATTTPLPPPSEPTPTPTTFTGEVTATATLGGETTVITTEGSTAAIEVPPDAVISDTIFEVSPIAETSVSIAKEIAALPAGKSLVGNNIFDYSATISGTNVSVSAFSANVTLTFTYTAAQMAGLDAAKVEVQYYDAINGLWKSLPTTINTATKTITALTNHFTRFAVVAPADITPPAAPTGITANAIAGGQIKLSWVNPTSDFSHAKVYRSTTSGQLGSVRISEVFGITYTDTGVTNGTKYYYTVRSVDPAGNESINTAQIAVTAIGTFNIVDGDLIKTSTSFDIYIVKLIEGKQFKRLILNPAIFNSYGHLKWENVKTVSQSAQDSYTLADLVIEVNPDGSVFDPKVYRVSSSANSDVGIKQWLNMTAVQFTTNGYDWDAIYKINHTEASPNFYPEGAAIKSSL